jgi:hypothetical protein
MQEKVREQWLNDAKDVSYAEMTRNRLRNSTKLFEGSEETGGAGRVYGPGISVVTIPSHVYESDEAAITRRMNRNLCEDHDQGRVFTRLPICSCSGLEPSPQRARQPGEWLAE